MDVKVASATMAGFQHLASAVDLQEGWSGAGEGINGAATVVNTMPEMFEAGFVPGQGGGKSTSKFGLPPRV